MRRSIRYGFCRTKNATTTQVVRDALRHKVVSRETKDGIGGSGDYQQEGNNEPYQVEARIAVTELHAGGEQGAK